MTIDPSPAGRALAARSPHASSLAVDLALLAALAGVAVLGLIRLDSALRSAAYVQSTGAEAPGLYGIAVVARGDPLYHELTTNPTTLVFGYSFYLLYGGVARLLGLTDAQAVWASKALTAAAAGAITAALIALTRPWWRGLPRRARARVFAVALIVGLGPFTGWWLVTARPDVIAAGLEVLGLVCFLRDGRAPAPRDWRCALVLWALAPTFKQTAVTVSAGACLFLVAQGRWRRALSIPAVIGVAAVAVPALAWGRRYASHAFAAPAVSPWSAHQALSTASEALAVGAPVLAAGLLALWVLGRSPASSALATPLRLSVGVALAAALVLAAKNGSARNYYLAAFEVSGLAAMLALGDARVAAPRAAGAIALLVALHGAAAWAYVVAPGRVGAQRLPAPSAELRRMVETICAAPPPRFVESSYYALPHASCEYPAAVIDWTFYADAPASFPVLRVENVVAARGYRSLFVQPGSALHDLALRAGYRCGAPIAELVPCEAPASAAR